MRLLGGAGAGAVARHIILQLGALGGLGFPRRSQLGQPLGTLPLEIIIAAGIQRDLAAFEVEDIVHHIVEQVPLVADDHDGGAIGFQEVFQPHGGFKIKVVRRLVEQQQIGLGEQQRGQRDAHPPAAGVTVQRAVLRCFIKAEADQDAAGARRRRIGIDGDQPLVHFRQAMGIAMAGNEVLLFQHQRVALDIGSHHGFERRRRAGRGFLRHIAHAGGLGHVDAAAVRLQRTGDDLHQRGLAGAVAADEADAAAWRQRRAGIVEDGPAAKADGDGIDGQHAMRPSMLRCGMK